jgi:hypothetical protein
MPKYENGIIYKLCHCNDLENENIYIGSTTNFRRRKWDHKNNCNNENSKDFNYPVYQFIRENGGWDEWKMIPIEKYPCNDKKELEVRENYHIQLLKSKLNKNIPTRTKKEHYEANKEIILEKQKENYEANKEIILKKAKEYREANKEKITEYKKQYYEANKEQILKIHKNYREANKEIKKEQDKKYREANKEILSEKAKQRVVCDHCGCEVSKNNLARHQKTKKCIDSV